MQEILNDSQAALNNSLAAWERTQAWGKLDPGGEGFRPQLRVMFGRVVLTFQKVGRKPKISKNGRTLAEELIEGATAAGHSARYSMMTGFAIDPAQRIEPVKLAVRTARELVRRYDSLEDRSILCFASRNQRNISSSQRN